MFRKALCYRPIFLHVTHHCSRSVMSVVGSVDLFAALKALLFPVHQHCLFSRSVEAAVCWAGGLLCGGSSESRKLSSRESLSSTCCLPIVHFCLEDFIWLSPRDYPESYPREEIKLTFFFKLNSSQVLFVGLVFPLLLAACYCRAEIEAAADRVQFLHQLLVWFICYF